MFEEIECAHEVSAIEKNVDTLCVMMHGYGSDKDDLLHIVQFFQAHMPRTHFYIPDGIEKCKENGIGRQWFDLNKISDISEYGKKSDLLDLDAMDLCNKYSDQLEKSKNLILDPVHKKASEFGLLNEDIIFIGFSQGAMTALNLVLGGDKKYRSVISFSGKLIMPKAILNIETPVCLIHGMLDCVVDFNEMRKAYDILKGFNIHVECHEIANLSHSIDLNGISIAINFISKLTKPDR